MFRVSGFGFGRGDIITAIGQNSLSGKLNMALKIALKGVELGSRLNKIALKTLIFIAKSREVEASAQFLENLVDWLGAEMVYYAPIM